MNCLAINRDEDFKVQRDKSQETYEADLVPTEVDRFKQNAAHFKIFFVELKNKKKLDKLMSINKYVHLRNKFIKKNE